MYRETDRGLRYYVKEGERAGRQRSRRRSSVKAMAMGVTIDPSYAFPLPIFGINYLDFEFGGPEHAARAAVRRRAGRRQHPAAEARVDAARRQRRLLRASPCRRAIGSTSRERRARGRARADLAAVDRAQSRWQYTPFQKAHASISSASTATSRDHDDGRGLRRRRPARSPTASAAAWEYRRGGYSLLLNGTWFAAPTWEPWGFAAGDAGATRQPRTYTKYSASLSRDFYFNAFHKIHLNGAWFGGQRPRPVSRSISSGMFDDTRIHGVPASGVRFGELAMARGSYSFNIFEQYRLDLFLEQAWGRDDRDRRAAGSRLPGSASRSTSGRRWNTILRADVGKSLLPAGTGRSGRQRSRFCC